MRVFYARVSSSSQNLSRQLDLAHKDHCQKIFQEKISGATTNRPELHKMLDYIHDGDIVEVASLDRLGRNKDDDEAILSKIKAKGATIDIANFDMMTPPIKQKGETDNHFKQRQNTYGLINSILIELLSYVAETERREIKERQRQGIASAKRRGVYKGKQTKYGRENKDLQEAFDDYFNRDKNGMSASKIAKAHGISRSTLYKKLRKYKPKKYNMQFNLSNKKSHQKN